MFAPGKGHIDPVVVCEETSSPGSFDLTVTRPDSAPPSLARVLVCALAGLVRYVCAAALYTAVDQCACVAEDLLTRPRVPQRCLTDTARGLVLHYR